LYKIATNCTLTALRRDRRLADSSSPLIDEIDTVPDGDPLPDAQFMSGQTLEEIRLGIETLPPKQRAALVMRYVQELDYAEIASALGCSEDSARANVYQAIKRLRVALADPVES
jgi:RNA polymerase sigma-70 factor (ECF subfamily)